MARRSKRSSSMSVLSKSKNMLNRSVNRVSSILRKSSNLILGLGNRALKTLKIKRRRSKHSRRH
jgi:hypothetical protein